MKTSLVRTVGALALLVSLCFPLGAQSEISTPPGSAERIAKMEAELKAMQEEAAKDPSRPTMAELQRDMDQMLAEKNAAAARRSGAARREWLMGLSLGLNVALALALLAVLSRRGGRMMAGA
ncbi:MAG TPA: hypothetical protein VGG20_26865 [Thermoanaerobaculia bacterium]|jgi:hypothetical protein